jgi:protein tyrosine/serine phosphatase
VAALALGAFLWRLQQTGNFAVVVPGEVFRSNQPTPARLAEYRDTYGIRAVLNLRGAKPDSKWYRQERVAAENLGLAMIDFPMSSTEMVTPERIEELKAVMKSAPKPLLIHCRSGANRTGLASLVYQALIAGVDEEVAEYQLSPLYGHVALPVISASWRMDQSWENLELYYGWD